MIVRRSANCVKATKNMKGTKRMETKLRSVLVEARLWHDKTYGNTYHAVRIHANGQLIGSVGMTYGYERMFEQTALAWLKQYGLVSEDTSSLVALREWNLDIYTTHAPSLKKDLWANWANDAWITKIKEGRV